jgi:hypothetical protein
VNRSARFPLPAYVPKFEFELLTAAQLALTPHKPGRGQRSVEADDAGGLRVLPGYPSRDGTGHLGTITKPVRLEVVSTAARDAITYRRTHTGRARLVLVEAA